MAYSRRILLVITGLTPQVVTETVFALWRENPEALPTEIHVLSTAEGVERARLTLFSDEPGWFRRLCKDYRLPPIRFGADGLHTLTDANGRPLSDIRSGQDNDAAADGVAEWVRRLTEDESAQLHVSLAGGRKTLGFFAGYALSLYGRPQDRLSHVLVEAPFESHPGFFYPTPYSHVIFGPLPGQKPLDTKNAAIILADLPFVRLRHGLPEALLKGRSRFSETVRAAQRTLGPARLDIDPAERRAAAGGVALPFPPAELAFYTWLARRARRGLPPLPCPPDGAPDRDYAESFLAEYRAIAGEPGNGGRVLEGLRHGMDKNYFERRMSRVNRILREVLGPGADVYRIKAFGRRPRTAYGLSLSAGQIVFCD